MDNGNRIDYDLVKNYCGQDLSFKLQGALKSLKNTEIKIVNTGMVSSGKSSLYNVLTGHTEEEHFPTGAARTTTIADSFKYNDFIYVDTPGIDVKDIDDDIAFGTIMESDIVIFVHNIKMGPLTRAESDWIKKISEGMGNDDEKKRRLIFVCTWKDMREKEDGYESIFEEVCNMAYEAVGTEIKAIDVSVYKYQNGIKKNKQILCDNSGIPELKELIDMMAREYSNYKVIDSKEQYKRVAEEVERALIEKRIEKEKEVMKKNERATQKYNSVRKAWTGVFEYFSSLRKSYDVIQQELNRM